MKPDLLCRHDLLPSRSLLRRSLFDHAHDVALLRDDEILAVDFDLGARFPNSTRSPTLTSSGWSLPSSPREPGPAAMTSPSIGFSLAVSGMIIPPAVFSSS